MEINHLKNIIKHLQQENDILQFEIGDFRKEKKEDQYANEAIISGLEEELEKFQQNAKLETFSSGCYSTTV